MVRFRRPYRKQRTIKKGRTNPALVDGKLISFRFSRSGSTASRGRLFVFELGGLAAGDFLEDAGLDLRGEGRVALERFLGGFAALANEFAVEGDPGALLLEDFVVEAEVEQRTGGGDALVV